MKKIILAVLLVVLCTNTMCFASVLGSNEYGQYCIKDNGELAVSEWVNEDFDMDGKKEYYYFGVNYIMLKNAVTPDGYQVNEEGKWIINGVVQLDYGENTNNGFITYNLGHDIVFNVLSKIKMPNLSEYMLKYVSSITNRYCSIDNMKLVFYDENLQKYSVSFEVKPDDGVLGSMSPYPRIKYRSFDINGNIINDASINIELKNKDNVDNNDIGQGVINLSTNEKVVEFYGTTNKY